MDAFSGEDIPMLVDFYSVVDPAAILHFSHRTEQIECNPPSFALSPLPNSYLFAAVLLASAKLHVPQSDFACC